MEINQASFYFILLIYDLAYNLIYWFIHKYVYNTFLVMNALYALLIGIALLITCVIVDRHIKGTRSVVIKAISAVLVGSFIIGFIYIYGQSFLTTFGVNTKSFTNIKAFVARQLFRMLVLVLLFLAIVVRITTHVTLKKEEKTEYHLIKNDQCDDVVYFDEVEIPNIETSFSATNFRRSIKLFDGFSFANLAREGI